MNEIIKAMLERRSVRKYKPDMIPSDVMEQIIQAGLFAANGRGKQSPLIIAVTKKEVRDKLSKLNGQIGGWDPSFDPFYGAPVVLIVVAPKDCHTYLYDGSLVIGNMMLAAYTLGIGSCWIHRAKEEFERPEWKEVLKSLGVNGDYEGIGHCILGYADGPILKATPRKEKRVYYIR